jgi:hypothetical protein
MAKSTKKSVKKTSSKKASGKKKVIPLKKKSPVNPASKKTSKGVVKGKSALVTPVEGDTIDAKPSKAKQSDKIVMLDAPTRGCKWSEKKVSVFKAYKKLGATDVKSAVSMQEIVKVTGLDLGIIRYISYYSQFSKHLSMISNKTNTRFKFWITKVGSKIKLDKILDK